MIDLKKIDGPIRLYNAGVENNTDHYIQWQLVRDSGAVLVRQAVSPHSPIYYYDMFDNKVLIWQFMANPFDDGSIIVPEGMSITLQATELLPAAIQYTDEYNATFTLDTRTPFAKPNRTFPT